MSESIPPIIPPVITSPATESILIQTLFLILLRIIYFFACQYFVKFTLLKDLNQVIKQDSGGSNSLEDEEEDELELGYFSTASTSSSNSNGSSNGSSSTNLTSSSNRDGLVGSPIRANRGAATKIPTSSNSIGNEFNNINLNDSTSNKKQQNSIYPKLSTILFCLSFSECCMLFTLLIFGEVVGSRARMFNWSLSLLALLSLIVFIIPLGLCLLLTHRSKSTTPLSRTLFLTLIPFTIYLFLFYQVGSFFIASKSIIEGSNSDFILINSLLARVCVPGVVLIAGLSGGGAVNTAWLAWERRSISSSAPITDEEIVGAERALARARNDIYTRTRSLATAQNEAITESNNFNKSSMLTRWTQSKPFAEQCKLLEIELKAMEEVESEMRNELMEKKMRREIVVLNTTFKGKIWLALGWALSVYCVWRIFISCINLIFGYSQNIPSTLPPSIPPIEGSTPSIPDPTPTPTPVQQIDILTSLITQLAVFFNLDLDISTWSRLIGLILIGSIIMVNMRVVLGSVSRIFKATTHTSTSSSFLLLILSLLMSLYLLTSLISLPLSPSSSTSGLLETLPSFRLFSRLFDAVFLVSAAVVGVLRWGQTRVRIALE